MLSLRQFGGGATLFLNFHGEFEELVRSAASLGFGYLELICEPYFLYPREISPLRRARLRRTLLDHELTPTVHTTFYDLNLASPNPLIREASTEELLESIAFAADLGARLAVVHAGRLPGDYPASLVPTARLQLLEGLREALDLAEGLGVTLALENSARGHDRGLIESAEEHLELVAALGSPHCKAALDVGHAHTFALDLVDYLRQILPCLGEVHLHDNDGVRDLHRPLGEGTIDFGAVLEALEREAYAGPLILEMVSLEDLKQSEESLVRQGYVRRP
ncbi:MAG: sugar phosphate isomerase/epimerase [Candidatus Acetothermia bacterium]|jgi:sugar phosphate isomerase/epimerase|nr:sugar phosphate isomerase/epimerase [Candidatus Acetothermia bacterium]MDH7506044.1 sugar phosphate isomerase/epimerase family protein [Candidatus Acetothermia bacterium]